MITLEANYSKKLGLPNYSSHQYSLTVRKEVSDVTQIENESRQLFATLQANVDRDIQQTGFLPGNNGNGNGHRPAGNGGGNGDNGAWKCSRKQQDLITKIVEEHKLDKNEVEALAQDRFGKGVKELNKLEASGLIAELNEKIGYRGNERARNQGGYQRAGGR
jgi:hypothetical protein